MQLLHTRYARIGGTLLVMGALSGCGGGGSSPTPSNQGPFTIDGSLTRADFYDSDNDRYYDIFVTEPTRSGTAQVEMTSPDVDSQVYIYRRRSNGSYDLIAQDDDSGNGPDALVRFDVQRGDVYRVITTSAQPRELGFYRAYFSRELGRPAIVPSDQNALTASGLKLPTMPAKSAASTPTK